MSESEWYKAAMERLKNPTPEQEEQSRIWVNKHMNRAGRMTQDRFDSVMEAVLDLKCIDLEDFGYNKKYKIPKDDFNEVYSYVEAELKDEIREDPECHFNSGVVFFIKGYDIFEWSLTHGQGSLCIIRKVDADQVHPGFEIHNLSFVNTETKYNLPKHMVTDEGKRK